MRKHTGRPFKFSKENVMGIDTRFWGPSGWQLFHWISFRSEHPEEVLKIMKDVLPCKFCRKSTSEFVSGMPLTSNPGKWLYDLHNKVNHKLRTQCKGDKAVVDPGPDPSFEDVKQKYETMKLTDVLGRDFLFSVAANYPEKPSGEEKATQQKFMDALAKVYPLKELFRFPANLNSRKSYMKWMYSFLKRVADKVKVPIPSYRGYVMRAMYYTSGCENKTYKGKTCRRIRGIGLTKSRDHSQTRRKVAPSLL